MAASYVPDSLDLAFEFDLAGSILGATIVLGAVLLTGLVLGLLLKRVDMSL